IDFSHKFRRLFEAAVNAGKSNVGHFIDLAQGLHNPFPDGHAGNFTFIFIADLIHDPLHEVFDDFWADGALLAGLLETGEQLFLGELLPPPIALDHHKSLMLNLFVGSEAVVALQTLAAAADGRAFAGGARVDDLVVLIAALWTAHKIP